MKKSKNNLDALVESLKPTLSKHGFEFEPGQNSYSSPGEFAVGFFKHPKIKIGLIFRGDKLGSVNYETKATNVSHEMIIRGIKTESDQKLFYDDGGGGSFTLDDQNIKDALLHDLENIVIPYILATSEKDINSQMLKERNKMWE